MKHGAERPLLAGAVALFVVDPRPVGGSMMRIYRDTRFSFLEFLTDAVGLAF
jgi:hypothetical protein